MSDLLDIKLITVGVELENGDTTWVSRRRVRYVKESLTKRAISQRRD